MNTDAPLRAPVAEPQDNTVADQADSRVENEAERAVEGILDDCFFALGQSIGMRMTVDYDAIMFIREHFRVRFLAAMRNFGNRWAQDRQNVTGVAMMLGERAVRYAGARESIDIESARQAAADVQRYCKLHARRAGKLNPDFEGGQSRIAGYWCSDDDGD